MTTSFGKFRLLERIGGGRLSQVYRIGRIWGEETTPKVVLKRVAPELIGEPGFVQLVAREAGLLSRLDHESLCACEEMGVIDGCAFLTLDLVDGCTVRALLRRLSQMEHRLPISAVLSLGAQAAQVLDYLHRHSPTPLVHLDLSPQNVMISCEGQLKLIDFGIARFLDGHNPPPLDGRIAGTVGYMSPEQARGQSDIPAQADQFGLGILLWEMLSGRRLYAGNTDETWKRMREGDTPPLAEGFPDVGPELGRVVDRLLEARPSDRYADLDVFCDELKLLTSNIESGRRPLAALTRRLMGETDFDPFDHVRRVGSRDLQDATLDRESGESGELGESGESRYVATASPMAAFESSHNIPTGEIPIDTYAELSIAVDHVKGHPHTRCGRSSLQSPQRLAGEVRTRLEAERP
ncbi:MAG: serine/threonine protein kinase [Deltaproteobacteria bacterium]|nr:serine/threonine protein kinase [Deltaproteobacteria bacterium]